MAAGNYVQRASSLSHLLRSGILYVQFILIGVRYHHYAFDILIISIRSLYNVYEAEEVRSTRISLNMNFNCES